MDNNKEKSTLQSNSSSSLEFHDVKYERIWKHKLALFFLIMMALTLPLALFAVMRKTNLNSGAAKSIRAPITPPGQINKNHKPKVLTKFLGFAETGVEFMGYINGFDNDGYDSLQMEVTNLPPNFEVQDCDSIIQSNKLLISCVIQGEALTAGDYDIQVRITDSKGAYDTESIKFRIYGDSMETDTKMIPSAN